MYQSYLFSQYPFNKSFYNISYLDNLLSEIHQLRGHIEGRNSNLDPHIIEKIADINTKIRYKIQMHSCQFI